MDLRPASVTIRHERGCESYSGFATILLEPLSVQTTRNPGKSITNWNLGPGSRIGAEVQQFAYVFSRCMTCGCCLEACPQVNSHSKYMGPQVIGQVYLMDQHPTGAMNQDERLETLMGIGGLMDCGNSQNCDEVCPKGTSGRRCRSRE